MGYHREAFACSLVLGTAVPVAGLPSTACVSPAFKSPEADPGAGLGAWQCSEAQTGTSGCSLVDLWSQAPRFNFDLK